MAKNSRNIVTHGLSGKLGDLIVFRQKGDETIVAAKPKKHEGEPSEAQAAIRNDDGTELERGAAVKTPNGLDWVYTATAANQSLQGTIITVRASDTPGHIAEMSQAV